MKVLALMCVSVAALALSSASADVPSAPSKKGPSFYRLAANDAAAEKACKDKGGAVSTDQDGYKICTLPRSCPAPGGPTVTVRLDAGDAAAAKKCQDACGVVSMDRGAQVCTKPEGY
jgi:hypothetical protein